MSFGIVSYTSNIRYHVVTAPTMLPPEATSLLQEIMVERGGELVIRETQNISSL